MIHNKNRNGPKKRWKDEEGLDDLEFGQQSTNRMFL